MLYRASQKNFPEFYNFEMTNLTSAPFEHNFVSAALSAAVVIIFRQLEKDRNCFNHFIKEYPFLLL